MATGPAADERGLGSPPARFLLAAAASRGVLLAALHLLIFFGLLAAVSSYEGFLSTGPVAFSRWDLAFVALLGLVAGPTTLLEEWLRRPAAGWPRTLGVGLAVGGLAGVGFLAVVFQLTYLFTIGRGPTAALLALDETALNVAEMLAESRTLIAAFAPSFGLAAVGRLRGWRLGWQMGAVGAGTLLCFYASVQGFVGLPIVRWLAGSDWAHPIVGTFVYLLPLPHALALPLSGRAYEFALRRVSPDPS